MRWNVYFNCRFFILRWQKRKRLNKSKNQLNVLLIFVCFIFSHFHRNVLLTPLSVLENKNKRGRLISLSLLLSLSIVHSFSWRSLIEQQDVIRQWIVCTLKTRLENTFNRIRSSFFVQWKEENGQLFDSVVCCHLLSGYGLRDTEIRVYRKICWTNEYLIVQ